MGLILFPLWILVTLTGYFFARKFLKPHLTVTSAVSTLWKILGFLLTASLFFLCFVASFYMLELNFPSGNTGFEDKSQFLFWLSPFLFGISLIVSRVVVVQLVNKFSSRN